MTEADEVEGNVLDEIMGEDDEFFDEETGRMSRQPSCAGLRSKLAPQTPPAAPSALSAEAQASSMSGEHACASADKEAGAEAEAESAQEPQVPLAGKRTSSTPASSDQAPTVPGNACARLCHQNGRWTQRIAMCQLSVHLACLLPGTLCMLPPGTSCVSVIIARGMAGSPKIRPPCVIMICCSTARSMGVGREFSVHLVPSPETLSLTGSVSELGLLRGVVFNPDFLALCRFCSSLAHRGPAAYPFPAALKSRCVPRDVLLCPSAGCAVARLAQAGAT